jgi:pyrroloquinoline quinone biosynthesis protein B
MQTLALNKSLKVILFLIIYSCPMEITVLGSASIGGVPEWDCTCPNCSDARASASLSRTRSSVSINVDKSKYVLIDAGPDIKVQLETRRIIPRKTYVGEKHRECRIDSVFLTHGHADHTLGIAEFCTGKSFEIPVYAPYDLIKFLFGTREVTGYFAELGRLAKDYVKPIIIEEDQKVTRIGEVKVSGFEVKHTQLLSDGRKYPSSTFAYEVIHDSRKFVYAPDIGELNESTLSRIKGADILMIDATFWWDNELERISGIPVTSYQLGHLPLEESVGILSELNIGRVIYTHFNHTNPVLDPCSEFVKIINKAGHEMAYDGLKIEV